MWACSEISIYGYFYILFLLTVEHMDSEILWRFRMDFYVKNYIGLLKIWDGSSTAEGFLDTFFRCQVSWSVAAQKIKIECFVVSGFR